MKTTAEEKRIRECPPIRSTYTGKNQAKPSVPVVGCNEVYGTDLRAKLRALGFFVGP